MSEKIEKIEKDNKGVLITFRLNNEQASTIKAWANRTGTSVSDVIRSAIEVMTGAKQ